MQKNLFIFNVNKNIKKSIKNKYFLKNVWHFLLIIAHV